MTAIDLLYGDAEPAEWMLDDFKPVMSKDECLAFERGLFRTECWKPEVSSWAAGTFFTREIEVRRGWQQ